MPYIGDNYGINTDIMGKLGYTVLKKDENGKAIADIDWEKTRAIQQRSNSIFINCHLIISFHVHKVEQIPVCIQILINTN